MLFKRAFVSGVNAELVRRDMISWPSKEAADNVCDAIADQLGGPEISTEAGVDPEKVASVANRLLAVAAEAVKQAQGVTVPQPKVASDDDFANLAYHHAERCMQKAAAEVSTGTAEPNTLASAAGDNAEAAMDNAERPQGAYNVEQGEQADAGRGTIGEEDTSPGEMGGSNSAVDASKAAAEIADVIRKLAAGTDQMNTPESAAMDNAEAAADQSERPQGTYLEGPGNTTLDASVGSIGHEESHPKTQENTPLGSNSVIEMSQKAAAFDELVKLLSKADKK